MNEVHADRTLEKTYTDRYESAEQHTRFRRRSEWIRWFVAPKVQSTLKGLLNRGEIWTDQTDVKSLKGLSLGSGPGFKRRALLASLPRMVGQYHLTEVDRVTNGPVLPHPRRLQVSRIKADMRMLPLDGEQFDVVSSFAAIHHIPPEDIPLLIAEIVRVARRNAVIVIGDALALSNREQQEALQPEWRNFGEYVTQWWLTRGYGMRNGGGTFHIHAYENLIKSFHEQGIEIVRSVRSGWTDTLIGINRKRPLLPHEQSTPARGTSVIDLIAQAPVHPGNCPPLKRFQRVVETMV